MANELFIYAKPETTTVQLTLDSGQVVRGHTTSANGRDDCHILPLPTGTNGQGGVLTVSADGYATQYVRGIVCPTEDAGPATFVFDDFGTLATAETTPEPAPGPTLPASDDPEAIIQAVYELGTHDLATHDGCGQFTEDCCIQLHLVDPMWGHIRKNPGQNQYNGHAVDALMLLAGEGCGIYDIIHDSVSPNASPSYNYKGPPDPEIWYYPTSNVTLLAKTL